MPIYEYICLVCRQETERVVAYSEADKQKCACDGNMKRKISVPGYVWQPTKESHRRQK